MITYFYFIYFIKEPSKNTLENNIFWNQFLVDNPQLKIDKNFLELLIDKIIIEDHIGVIKIMVLNKIE